MDRNELEALMRRIVREEIDRPRMPIVNAYGPGYFPKDQS